MTQIDPEIRKIMKKAYPYIREYNPAQQKVIDSGYLENNSNYIISIPTASGKTVLGVLAILKTLQGGGKAVYAVPLISLQNEKYREFKVFEQFGYRVGKHPGNADIAVMVFESFDMITRYRNTAGEIDLVIIDEFHMIGDYSRGPTIECAITRLMDKNRSIRIIALSATLKNMEELAGWLDAEVVEHDYRPVPLHKEVLCTEEFSTKDKNNIVYKILSDSLNDSSQMLTFVSTRRFTEALARKMAEKISKKIPEEQKQVYNTIAGEILDVSRKKNTQPTQVCHTLAGCIKNGVAFHHAGLFDRQKQIIEEEFTAGNLLMITATPSLMYGVNLPSKNVVIRDYTRWTEQGNTNIPVFDYEQMSGRAGRPGYDTEGNSYLIAKSYDEAYALDEHYVHGEIELTTSKLIENENAVLRQIITQISAGLAKDINSLVDFFKKTFYGFQIQHTYHDMGFIMDDDSVKYEITTSLEYLADNGIIRITPTGLQTTPFGTIISKSNYSVKTAVKLKQYMQTINEFNPYELIYEISKTRDMPKISPKYRANKDNIKEVLNNKEIYTPTVTNNETTAAALIEWIQEKKEYEIENHLKVYAATTRRSSYEGANLVKYFHDICEIHGEYKHLTQINKLSARLYYGVKEDLIPLVVSIKQLGRQRARNLTNTFGQNLKNITAKELMKINGIGKTTADNIENFYKNK